MKLRFEIDLDVEHLARKAKTGEMMTKDGLIAEVIRTVEQMTDSVAGNFVTKVNHVYVTYKPEQGVDIES